jgi:hypothetical protein
MPVPIGVRVDVQNPQGSYQGFPHLRVGWHDHSGRTVFAGEPGALLGDDGAVLEVCYVFAEVTDGSIIALGVLPCCGQF